MEGAYSGELTLEHDRVSYGKYKGRSEGDYEQPTGRWPANFILTHLEGCTSHGEDWACVEGCPAKELDQQSGHLKSGGMKAGSYKQWGKNGIYGEGKEHPATYYGDEGGASRFFKQFKGS